MTRNELYDTYTPKEIFSAVVRAMETINVFDLEFSRIDDYHILKQAIRDAKSDDGFVTGNMVHVLRFAKVAKVDPADAPIVHTLFTLSKTIGE